MGKQVRQERRIRSTRARGRRSEGGAGIGFSLPYDRRNWTVIGAGLLLIAIGYWCLGQPPVDGAVSLTIAPVLLVLGYCVIIPVGLLLGRKEAAPPGAEAGPEKQPQMGTDKRG